MKGGYRARRHPIALPVQQEGTVTLLHLSTIYPKGNFKDVRPGNYTHSAPAMVGDVYFSKVPSDSKKIACNLSAISTMILFGMEFARLFRS